MKLRKIGNSVGVLLPKDVLATANLSEGEEVTVVPVQDGVFVSAANSPQGRMLAAALEDMNDRPDLYRKLAE
ncbi:AbrB/MazE/SpoVT family DNA-binding domain-containing protein [Pontivivens ytuae]|uniref:AbrB/MazE/SpoVT family DNA-binding domain-containing protein n=1 Tax=Pontivivens ytuae TaxID=2789856 RepID=A0A7S9LTC2_9RHOB|nr:AbrB/MazE/SpoVT family DNA-binding domain-containing protein [Pontivivens ytuae]QPH54916.1 AbrB/MazE/SpoVT family DNA-binding domain-containing protein [Pontivivens ytuae]